MVILGKKRFFIVILLISIFFIALTISTSAQTTAKKSCCVLQGEGCFDIDDPNYNFCVENKGDMFGGLDCKTQVAVCREVSVGCCIPPEGSIGEECDSNARSQAECAGEFKEQSCDEIPKCQSGCCVCQKGVATYAKCVFSGIMRSDECEQKCNTFNFGQINSCICLTLFSIHKSAIIEPLE